LREIHTFDWEYKYTTHPVETSATYFMVRAVFCMILLGLAGLLVALVVVTHPPTGVVDVNSTTTTTIDSFRADT
jgi:hypothetical protein